jgi:Mg2+ and Co2+ transporter CorA
MSVMARRFANLTDPLDAELKHLERLIMADQTVDYDDQRRYVECLRSTYSTAKLIVVEMHREIAADTLNALEQSVQRSSKFMTPEALADYKRLLDNLSRYYGLAEVARGNTRVQAAHR